MKKSVVFQYQGKETTMQQVEKQVLEQLKAEGYLRKDIDTLQLYFNVNENTWYYVAVMIDDERFEGKVLI